ncbi:hypothetical protein D9758_017607 [Tetrapyrgos nigripes]|uniref:Uncharacterized protein n=1 Tax=Tetrapyrgos nigripes TaxID=182062 RepID=A0A8H5BBX6_9AGAR|nr:hypothetical protein D9758_017607 [Tetrapyrgos nigripes]
MYQAAVDQDTGKLKDADEIDWYNSESDEVPQNKAKNKRELPSGPGGKTAAKRQKTTSSNEVVDEESDTEMFDETQDGHISEASQSEEEMTPGEKQFLEAKAIAKSNPSNMQKKSLATADLRLCYKQDSRDGKAGVFCNFCRSLLLVILTFTHQLERGFYVGNVTSQRRHIERNHLDDYFRVCEDNGVEPKIKKPSGVPGVDGQQAITTFTVLQPPVAPFSLEGMLEYIIELFPDADEAVLLIDQASFRRLILYLWPKLSEKDIPHRTTLTKAIKEKHQLLIERDLGMIKPANNSPTEWTLHAHLLTFDRRKGRHTGEENGKHLASTIQKYGFADKVGWFTSDGVSVNDKSTRIACKILDPTGKMLRPKERQTNCIEHTFNLMPSHFCQALQIPSIMVIGQHLHDNEQEGLFEDFDDDIDPSGEEEPDDDDDEAVEQAMSTEWTPGDIVGKILAFVAQIRQCDAAMTYLKSLCERHCGTALQVATWVCTHWGSLAKCFDWMIEIQIPMNMFCATADDNQSIPPLADKKQWVNFKLSADEWRVVTLCRDVLMVTATRNAILGKEDVATSHWVIPAMHEVKAEWKNFLYDPKYNIIAPAIQAGLDSMYKWYRKVTEDTPVYFICHVLDPRRRLTFLEAAWEQFLIDKGLALMRKAFLTYKDSYRVELPTESTKKAMQRSSSYSAADSYMDKLRAAASSGGNNNSNPVSQYEELNKYLNADVTEMATCLDIIK